MEEEEDAKDEAESVQLQQFKHAGKAYFKDQYDTVYSMGDGKLVDAAPIGKWNQATRSIELNDSKKSEKDEASDDEEQEDEYEE